MRSDPFLTSSARCQVSITGAFSRRSIRFAGGIARITEAFVRPSWRVCRADPVSISAARPSVAASSPSPRKHPFMLPSSICGSGSPRSTKAAVSARQSCARCSSGPNRWPYLSAFRFRPQIPLFGFMSGKDLCLKVRPTNSLRAVF